MSRHYAPNSLQTQNQWAPPPTTDEFTADGTGGMNDQIANVYLLPVCIELSITTDELAAIFPQLIVKYFTDRKKKLLTLL